MPGPRNTKHWQARIMTGFGAVAFVTVLPFMVWRLRQADWIMAAIDLAVLLFVVFMLAALRRGADPQRMALPVMLLCSLAAWASGLHDPGAGTYWSYPVILANAVVLGAWRGAAISLLLILSVALPQMRELPPFTTASYFATTLLVLAFGSYFSERSQRQRDLYRQLALQDELTGAGNRRAMEWRLQAMREDAQRTRRPIGMMMLDLDHFKRVNDEFGHDKGDEVLRSFSEIVHGSTRAIDELFRMGGEEFVLVLPGVGVSALQARAAQLLQKVRDNLRCGERRVTVSIGGSCLRPGEPMESWLGRADAALYAAKEQGRDRAVVHELDTRRPGTPAGPDAGATAASLQAAGPTQPSTAGAVVSASSS